MAAMKINQENFEQEILQSEKPVLVDFWAPWCGPCRELVPVVDALAEELADVKVAKVNVDEEGELAGAFQIMSIPTLIVVKDGKIANQSIGAAPKNKILEML